MEVVGLSPNNERVRVTRLERFVPPAIPRGRALKFEPRHWAKELNFSLLINVEYMCEGTVPLSGVLIHTVNGNPFVKSE